MIREGLGRGNRLFASEWEDETFISKVEAFVKNMKGLLKTNAYLIQCKQEACRTTRSMVYSVMGNIEIIKNHKHLIKMHKQKMIDRYIYLENRKQCIEQELKILESRKQYGVL